MYGRSNYTAPVGQGPYTSTPTFHQHPLAPPPPISQSPHPSLPPMIQQGLHPIPSQVGQLSSLLYPHAPSALPHQRPPNSVMSTATNDQPYLAPAPPKPPPQSLQVHVTSQMPQHSQWTHSGPLIQLTGLSLAPRVLPPPPSLGQTPFSNQVNQPAAASIHAPVQQRPQSSSSHTISPVRPFEHLMPLSSNTPVKPPQPPTKLSSLPGSPRLHISSAAASESAVHPKVGLEISNSGSHEISAPGSVNLPPEMVSAHGENLTEDLPPPPLKPVDDRTVRSIELLCQFIAKNGPEFENMTRLKEFKNPEFKFLFGGELGTQAAVAHEYFVWAKQKCYLELRSAGKLRNRNSPLRQPEGFSSQQNIPCSGGVLSSPTDSDMDMEDDITHPDEEPHSFSSEKQNHDTVSVSNGLDKEWELQPSTRFEEPSLANDSVDGNLQHSESLGLMEQRQDVGLSLTVHKTSASHEGLSQRSSSAKPAEIMLQKPPSPLVNQGVSPFRLLQDYASDESSGNEDCHADILPTSFDPSVEVGSTSLGKDEGALESDKGLDQLPKPFKFHCSSSAKSEAVLVEADLASIPGKSKDFVDNSSANQEPRKDVISPGKQSRDDSAVPVGNAVKKKDPKSMSSSLKVDEFGRLIREGDSDNDFVGSPRYNRRRRGRSNSRSQSPHERRRCKNRSPQERRRSRGRSPHERRRRSPRRRSECRGLSRSLSPKRRRSRSRSPPYRHGGNTLRRDKGRRPECFDFVKGKCYRGASCRYMHHEEKSDRSRSYRSRQQFQDLPHGSRNSNVQEKFERPDRKLSHEINEGRTEHLKPLDVLPITEEKKDRKEVMDGTKNDLLEPSINLISDAKMERALGDAAHGRASAIDNAELQQSQSNFSGQLFQNADYQHIQIDTYPDTESTVICKPSSIRTQLPIDKSNLNGESGGEPCANSNSMDKPFPSENISSQSVVPKESVPPVADHLSNLPPLFPSVSQDTTSSFNHEIPRDYTLKPPSAKFPSFTAPAENFPLYQASVSYLQSEYPFQPNPSWNSAPAPPAQAHPSHPTFVNDMALTSGLHSGAAVHFVQNVMPPKNDFYSQSSARPYTDYSHSNVGQNQGYPSLLEPNRPPDHLDDPQPRTLATNPSMSQSQGGSGLAGEDYFTGRPGPGIYPSSSYGKESLLSQPMFFSRNLLYNFGTSQLLNHFNPYASTFEQPLSSKFSSNILVQEKDKSFNSVLGGPAFSHVPIEGRAVANIGSVLPLERVLPQPSDNQYDPLYDRIEPSLNSVKKSHYGQKHEMTDESDYMLRFDVEEKKQKGHGASELSGSLQNEEYGETADAEAGDVENGSPSNAIDAADKDGEVEMDHVKTPGKNKKSKDSRSMKLFKVAIANFVKEVLKPSWRQGNMSKEAFKTIVKKTVDRVSGAMKSHQIPKSQAKINHYINSSERKLTKLVMGYVDKYVKV